MRHSKKHAFTLVELLVVIAIIGTLVGLLLPAVQAAREAARSNTCRSNMTQLQKGLMQRESTLGSLPGYINNLGVKGTQNQIRASWVVMTFPYIEQDPLWQRWSQPDGEDISSVLGTSGEGIPELELLICPSDPPTIQGQPNLSYAANAGWIGRTHSLISTANIPAESPSVLNDDRENPANGVFFDQSRVPTAPNQIPNLMGPVDAYQDFPVISMSIAYIQSKGDGTTSTILLSENIHQVFWAYTNQLQEEYASDSAVSASTDEKYHFGICWEQPDVVVSNSATFDEKNRRVNGETNQDSYDQPTDITTNGLIVENPTSDGNPDLRATMPSSLHPGGVNIAFVGGSVRFVADNLEPRVFAQLMTSNRNKSDLVFNQQSEALMAPIGDNDF